MSILIGAALALLIGAMATMVGLDRDRAFYPTVLLVVASYYILFAAMAGVSTALWPELGLFVAYALAAIAGFKRALWLVVAGLALHGALDSVHGHLVSNQGVPAWWPGFCGGYDVVAAAYLAWRLQRHAISNRSVSSGNEVS